MPQAWYLKLGFGQLEYSPNGCITRCDILGSNNVWTPNLRPLVRTAIETRIVFSPLAWQIQWTPWGGSVQVKVTKREHLKTKKYWDDKVGSFNGSSSFHTDREISMWLHTLRPVWAQELPLSSCTDQWRHIGIPYVPLNPVEIRVLYTISLYELQEEFQDNQHTLMMVGLEVTSVYVEEELVLWIL